MLRKSGRLRAGSGTRKGCRLHTITASNGEGMPGGERIQATMVLRRSSDYIGSYIRERETAVRSPVFVIAAGRP